MHYSESRLATLMDLDVSRLIDCHLVVNLKEYFITPKTNHLTAHAKRHSPDCCVGIQYVYEDENQPHTRTINSTLDILIQSAGFLENSTPADGEQSAAEQNKESSLINRKIDKLNKIMMALLGYR